MRASTSGENCYARQRQKLIDSGSLDPAHYRNADSDDVDAEKIWGACKRKNSIER